VKIKTSVLSISDIESDQGDKEDVPGYYIISNSSSHSEPPRSGISSSAIHSVRRFLEITVHKYINPDFFYATKLQTRLAELLEEEGADIIQTEGGKCSSPTKPGVLGLIEKVA
jgi:hypothetical protein